jgi:hypothetical protein
MIGHHHVSRLGDSPNKFILLLREGEVSAIRRLPRLDVEATTLAKTFQMPKDSCRPT